MLGGIAAEPNESKGEVAFSQATETERHGGYSDEPGGFEVGVECGRCGWIEARFWNRHGPWTLDSG